MFKDDENREEYSDKLDRILEEADSKIKEKPKYEYVNENNSNRKKGIIAVLCVLACVVAVGVVVAWNSSKKSNSNKSADSELVEVGDLTGLTVEQAENVLKNSNISISIDKYDESDKYEKDQIISQNPQNKKVKKGTAIHVVLSNGPHMVTIPKLRGIKKAKAINKLKKLGLFVNVRGINSDDVKKGYVLGASVETGTKIAKGSEVDLTVSKGKSKNSSQYSSGDVDSNVDNYYDEQSGIENNEDYYEQTVESKKSNSYTPSQKISTTKKNNSYKKSSNKNTQQKANNKVPKQAQSNRYIGKDNVEYIRNTLIGGINGTPDANMENLAIYMSNNKLSNEKVAANKICGYNTLNVSAREKTVNISSTDSEEISNATDEIKSALSGTYKKYGIGISASFNNSRYYIKVIVVYQ